MKVCHIVSTFPRFEGDTQVPWLLNLATGLKNKGLQITVIAPSFKGLKSHAISGIAVKRFRYFFSAWETLTHEAGAPNKLKSSPQYWLEIPSYFLSGTGYILKETLREKFDILHIHWPIPHYLMSYPAKIFTGVPVVLHFHSAEFPLLKKFNFPKSLVKSIFARPEVILANSKYTGRLIEEWTGRKPIILPFGVEVKNNITPQKMSPPYKLLFVGRLIERKGVEYLIKALPHVLKKTKVVLHIVGGGPLSGELQALSKALGVDNHVVLHGMVGKDTLEDLYDNCDLFILPSIHDSRGDTEGLGVVLLEAMAHGKPVIASRVGGIVDIVKDGETGVLVEEKDEIALSNVILRLIFRPEERLALAERGYKLVKKSFSWDKVLKDTIRLYLSISPASCYSQDANQHCK